MAKTAAKRANLWLVANTGGGAVPSGREQPEARRPEPSLDDSELLAALRAGDASAAVALHDRIRPQVDRTIGRLLGWSDVDSEDLAQLALIEIVSTIDRYRGDCALDWWASTVTSHVVYKHLRRRQNERRLFSSLDAGDVAPRSAVHGARAPVIRDMLTRVLGHLDSVEESKAWAFVLHDVCGHDLREIADITGVTVSAAQSRLVRGRRELHEKIAADAELAEWLRELEDRP
jgi:RNA polymerase sigma-70 factor (ECF subfamily)